MYEQNKNIDNVEKYNLDKINFPWEKTTLQFSNDFQFYNYNKQCIF